LEEEGICSFIVSTQSPRLALVACLISSSCTTRARSSDDAGEAAAAIAESVSAMATPAPASTPDSAPPNSIVGEWERATEPYKGMRVVIRADAPAHAVVTAPPPVTQDRIAAQARSTPATIARTQLECQRSLWKPGEELVTAIAPAGVDAFDATILVRDWGVAGACRHADSHAPAHLVVSAGGELTIDVTRGKSAVTQHWNRVGP
jgi:hypothetical protein